MSILLERKNSINAKTQPSHHKTCLRETIGICEACIVHSSLSSFGYSNAIRALSRFADLLFHRGDPCFFAFDLLFCNGKDCRSETLTDRKQELRRLLAKTAPLFPLRFADHVDGIGTELFLRVCELDLEGVVAKHKSARYVSDRESSTWFKILNPEYSQREGRDELFERDRHAEPVPGWHSCTIACSEADAAGQAPAAKRSRAN